MSDEKARQVRNWLQKSLSDLGSAQRLLEGPEPYLDTAVYHCQQAAEKVLKGFLAYHDIVFARTHDLTELVGAPCRWIRHLPNGCQPPKN